MGNRAGGMIALACTMAAVNPAAAQPTDFYAGKSLRIIVGSTTGGYFDTAGRTVARFLPDHIPGKPAIIVQNQPDAGGVTAVNRLQKSIERDGLTIACIGQGLPQLALLGDPKVEFDPLAMTWLGALTSYKEDGYFVTVNAAHPARSWADVKAGGKPLYLGATRYGSNNVTFALIARDILKMNIEIITGFPGASEIWLGMERGEVDGQMVSVSAIQVGRPQLYTDRKLRLLVGFGLSERLKDWPEVPDALDIVKDPDDRALIEFAQLPFLMAAPFVGPPDIPADRTRILQTSFMSMAGTDQFQAELRKAGIIPSPVDGVWVRNLLERAAKTPPEVRRRFAAMLSQQK